MINGLSTIKNTAFTLQKRDDTQETIAHTIYVLLGYILSDSEMEVEVKKFDNCREYGFTFRAIGGKQDITFSVYEHRNSDQIIINGCMTEDVATFGAYNGSSKYDYLESFAYHEHYRVAEELAEKLLNSYKGKFDTSVFN